MRVGRFRMILSVEFYGSVGIYICDKISPIVLWPQLYQTQSWGIARCPDKKLIQNKIFLFLKHNMCCE